MRYNSKCKKCSQFGNHNWSNCNHSCSKKGKEKIKPKKFTMNEIKKVLENNIGCHISQNNICNYSKEIKELLK